MFIPATIYWTVIILLFLIILVFLFRSARKNPFFSFHGIRLKLIAILLLSSKLICPYNYVVQTCGTVKKEVLLFPVNIFGANLKMMADHCYILNETDRNLVLERVTHDRSKGDQRIIIPPRSGKKIQATRIEYFFENKTELYNDPQNHNDFLLLNCEEL